MDDKTCQNCGAPLVVRSSQIVQLPGETPKCYVDYDCPSVGCEGSIRVMTTPTGSETASPGRAARELPRPRRVPDDDTDVPDSLVVLKPSTGHSDFSERDFCADLATYTAAP